MARQRKAVRKPRARKAKLVRAPRQITYPIKRTIQFNISSNSDPNLGVALGSRTFALSELPVSSDFTNLFDQYRIMGVSMQCIPNVNSSFVGTPTSYSIFHYAVDETDSTPPASKTELFQVAGRKTVNTQGVNQFSIRLKPKASQTYWQGLTASGYGTASSGSWVNTSSPGVQHYGLKWAWDCNSNPATIIAVFCTYMLEFRQPV